MTRERGAGPLALPSKDGSLLFSADGKRPIWRVSYVGHSSQ